jgi:hypothetical protein
MPGPWTLGRAAGRCFARFAFPPNSLGLCGSETGLTLLSVRDGRMDADLRHRPGLEGAWPYLELISAENDFPHRTLRWRPTKRERPPGHVGIRAHHASETASATGHVRRNGAGWSPRLIRKRVHHSFHVLEVLPRIGLIERTSAGRRRLGAASSGPRRSRAATNLSRRPDRPTGARRPGIAFRPGWNAWRSRSATPVTTSSWRRRRSTGSALWMAYADPRPRLVAATERNIANANTTIDPGGLGPMRAPPPDHRTTTARSMDVRKPRAGSPTGVPGRTGPARPARPGVSPRGAARRADASPL